MTIPAAHESSAFKARATKTASAQKKAFLHDDRSWPKIRELNIPEYAADIGGPGDSGAIDGSDTQSMEVPARRGAGATSNDQQISKAPSQNQGGGFFGGLGGYIGLSGRSKVPILRSVPRSVLSGTIGPSDESVSEDEVIVVRDQAAVFLSFEILTYLALILIKANSNFRPFMNKFRWRFCLLFLASNTSTALNGQSQSCQSS